MFIKRFAVGMACTALLVPQLSLAATPQQLLDRAVVNSMVDQKPQASTLDFTFTFAYKPVARTEKPSSVKVHVIANAETMPRTDVSADAEQRFRVEAVDLVGAQELGLNLPLHWQDPASVEFKKIGNVYYVRIAALSNDLRALINTLPIPGINLDQIVGTWLKIDLDSVQQLLKENIGTTSMLSDNLDLSTSGQEDLVRLLLPVVKKPSVLRVTRLDSRTNRNGVMYTRVVFQVNPRLWTDLETVLRKQIEKELASLKVSNRKSYNLEYAARTKELRTAMTKARTELAKIKMVAMINEKTGLIERIEAAGKTVEPSYTQQYVNKRWVKKLEGYNEMSFSLVTGLKTIANREIAAPANFITLDSLIQMGKQQFEASLTP